MRKTTLLVTLVLSLGLALPAFAAPPKTPRVDHRQTRQQTRIAQGVKSGELTKKEAARLQRGEMHVRRAERRAEADGVITAAERARLEHKQDVMSARIYKQKHDGQQRPAKSK